MPYAEKGAWPYIWFVSPDYPQASGRGTVTGKLTINDSGNRNPIIAGTVVALIKQPLTSTGTYDFTKWFKPYQSDAALSGRHVGRASALRQRVPQRSGL